MLGPEERVLVNHQKTKEDIFVDVATQIMKGPGLPNILTWHETFAGHMGLDHVRGLLSEQFPSCRSSLLGDMEIGTGDLP